MTTNTKQTVIGFEDSDEALRASAAATATPKVCELADGSYAGWCDDTINSDGVRGMWVMVPSGLVRVERDDRTGYYVVAESLEHFLLTFRALPE